MNHTSFKRKIQVFKFLCGCSFYYSGVRMSNLLSRTYGVQQGRLLEYQIALDEVASQSVGAKRFRIAMCDFALRNAGKRVNGNVASFKTVQASKDALAGMATALWGLGYQLLTPEGLSEKHIRALVRHKWAFGISEGALSVLMTQLNKLAVWIKKPSMVKSPCFYLPEVDPKLFKRKKVALKSKSVTGNGYELETVINKADTIDQRFGVMVRMSIAFGLRRCELLQIKPHIDDKVLYLDIRQGVAKNGRHRAIPVETEAQRNTLNYAKSLILSTEHLGWLDKPRLNGSLLKRNENRYNDFMQQLGFTKKQLGITGHGLRAEYSENMALSKGFIPASLGGTKSHVLEQLDQESFDLARMQVAENMGHSRVSITSAYYGNLTAKIPNSLGQRLGMIQLSQSRAATVFINPPIIVQPTGGYARMSARKIERTAFTVLIEEVSSGLGVEFAKLDLKVFITSDDYGKESLSDVENQELRRLSVSLLIKFGVSL
jgi:integrase